MPNKYTLKDSREGMEGITILGGKGEERVGFREMADLGFEECRGVLCEGV